MAEKTTSGTTPASIVMPMSVHPGERVAKSRRVTVAETIRNREMLSRRFENRYRQGDERALNQLLEINGLFFREPWVSEEVDRWVQEGDVGRLRRLTGTDRRGKRGPEYQEFKWTVVYLVEKLSEKHKISKERALRWLSDRVVDGRFLSFERLREIYYTRCWKLWPLLFDFPERAEE